MILMLTGKKRFISDIASVEGSKELFLTSNFSHHQITNELTHAMKTLSFSTLIFTSQPNLVIESGVYSALHTFCHYQITYTKLNRNIVCPPLFEILI